VGEGVPVLPAADGDVRRALNEDSQAADSAGNSLIGRGRARGACRGCRAR
jgi:hypothetical protein